MATSNRDYYDAFADGYDERRGKGYHKLIDDQAAELVRRVERIETMLGSGQKEPVPAETRAIEALRLDMREVGFDG